MIRFESIWKAEEPSGDIPAIIEKVSQSCYYEKNNNSSASNEPRGGLLYSKRLKSIWDEIKSGPSVLKWNFKQSDSTTTVTLKVAPSTAYKWTLRGLIILYFSELYRLLGHDSTISIGSAIFALIFLVLLVRLLTPKCYKETIAKIDRFIAIESANKLKSIALETMYPDIWFISTVAFFCFGCLFLSNMHTIVRFSFRNWVMSLSVLIFLVILLLLASNNYRAKILFIYQALMPPVLVLLYFFSFSLVGLHRYYPIAKDQIVQASSKEAGLLLIIHLLGPIVCTALILLLFALMPAGDDYKSEKERYKSATKISVEGIALANDDFLWKAVVTVVWALFAVSLYYGVFKIGGMIRDGIAGKELTADNYMANWNYGFLWIIAVLLKMQGKIESVQSATLILITAYILPIAIIAFQSLIRNRLEAWRVNDVIKKGNPHPLGKKILKELQGKIPAKTAVPIILQDATGRNGNYTMMSIWSYFRRKQPVILINKELDDAQILDDDGYKALIAHELYHLTHHHRTLWYLQTLSTITFCGSNLLPSILNFWKMEYEADCFAAKCVGKEPLCSALKKIHDSQKDKNSTERLFLRLFGMCASPQSQSNVSAMKAPKLFPNIRNKWNAIISHFSGEERILKYQHPSYDYRIEEIRQMAIDSI